MENKCLKWNDETWLELVENCAKSMINEGSFPESTITECENGKRKKERLKSQMKRKEKDGQRTRSDNLMDTGRPLFGSNDSLTSTIKNRIDLLCWFKFVIAFFCFQKIICNTSAIPTLKKLYSKPKEK